MPSTAKPLIPEYTSDQAKSWLDGISTDIGATADVVLIVLTLAGFLVFVMGIMRYMRAARDAASGGGGGGEGYRESVWMIVGGVLFSLIGGIFIYFVAFGRANLT